MPFGSSYCQIDFDFINQNILFMTDNGDSRSIALKLQSVSDFCRATREALNSLNITAPIWTTPVEVPERIPFEQDNSHSAYNPEYAHRHWKVLVQVDRVVKIFRSRFIGKVRPVHFFWGAFDMAVTRFSGGRAPEHPGVPNASRRVMVEAYSHEVSGADSGLVPGLVNHVVMLMHIWNLKVSRNIQYILKRRITIKPWE